MPETPIPGSEQPSVSTAPPRSRRRRLAFALILVFCGVAVALALCEAVLWLFAPVPYHEWLVWESEGHIRARPVPHQTIRTAAGYDIRINKDGFRGPDHAYEKPPGTLRIAVFSGSAGFCYDASSVETAWPNLLETGLSETLDMPVQVINLALPGFDAFNSKINYLCYGRAFEPDAILVYHAWNDMKQFRDRASRPYRPQRSVPNKPLWQRVARATQFGRRARNVVWRYRNANLENKFVADSPELASLEAPVHARAFEWERRNFVDFVRLAHGDGVLPILVSQGTLCKEANLSHDDPEMRAAMLLAADYAGMTPQVVVETWAAVTRLIEDVAAEHDAIYIDGYAAVPADLTHLLDHVHLIDPGLKVLADEMVRVLGGDERFLAVVERVRAEAGAGA